MSLWWPGCCRPGWHRTVRTGTRMFAQDSLQMSSNVCVYVCVACVWRVRVHFAGVRKPIALFEQCTCDRQREFVHLFCVHNQIYSIRAGILRIVIQNFDGKTLRTNRNVNTTKFKTDTSSKVQQLNIKGFQNKYLIARTSQIERTHCTICFRYKII